MRMYSAFVGAAVFGALLSRNWGVWTLGFGVCDMSYACCWQDRLGGEASSSSLALRSFLLLRIPVRRVLSDSRYWIIQKVHVHSCDIPWPFMWIVLEGALKLACIGLVMFLDTLGNAAGPEEGFNAQSWLRDRFLNWAGLVGDCTNCAGQQSNTFPKTSNPSSDLYIAKQNFCFSVVPTKVDTPNVFMESERPWGAFLQALVLVLGRRHGGWVPSL